MPAMNSQQIKQVMRYLRVWLRAFQNTVELAGFAAEDVLAGKATEFSDLDKDFLEALDHVIYHTAHSARAAVTMLLKHRACLMKRQLSTVKNQQRQYREIFSRLAALTEALADIYVFRNPPH